MSTTPYHRRKVQGVFGAHYQRIEAILRFRKKDHDTDIQTPAAEMEKFPISSARILYWPTGSPDYNRSSDKSYSLKVKGCVICINS